MARSSKGRWLAKPCSKVAAETDNGGNSTSSPANKESSATSPRSLTSTMVSSPVSSVKHLIPSLSALAVPPFTPTAALSASDNLEVDAPPPIFAYEMKSKDKECSPGYWLMESEGIRPIQLLLNRLQSWQVLLKRIYDHFVLYATVESQVTKSYQKMDQALFFKQPNEESSSSQNGSDKDFLLHENFSPKIGIRAVLEAWQHHHRSNARQHSELENFLRLRALPKLAMMKKELKRMIGSVRCDDRLTLSTLCKLKEEAARRVARLNKQLTWFDDHPHLAHTQQDPWLMNSSVVKQLTKVYQHENKIHDTVLRLQRQVRRSEENIVEEMRQLCLEMDELYKDKWPRNYSGIRSIMQLFDGIQKHDDWYHFVDRCKDQLVSDRAGFRHPEKLRYQNHNHPLLQPLFAARMERKSSVLQQWQEHIYVLTPAGFLHEYKHAKNYPARPDCSRYVPHFKVTTLSNNLQDNLIFRLQPGTVSHATDGSIPILANEWISTAPSIMNKASPNRGLTLRAQSAEHMQVWLSHLFRLSDVSTAHRPIRALPMRSHTTPSIVSSDQATARSSKETNRYISPGGSLNPSVMFSSTRLAPNVPDSPRTGQMRKVLLDMINENASLDSK
ncbi:uncharacterized protein BYT42DRAFT_611474 [Radiomyces spectabilis]|uniref:uncharacterized protein n=1 Tax=Radiomyces spectabilis TaxID=64574 RepID=UPI002220FC54|nr:uncharacterized protein BYT42DRAFT_611474 [Radiomyces spectabilis]KAI8388427.1 hypothetical protein BYT42DRAFT_611474 [Radiomyces spectabilis]